MSNATSPTRTAILMLRLACVVLLGLCIGAASAAVVQRTFASPDEAVTALIDAVKANDQSAAFAILGPGTESWVRSGDSVADAAARESFLSKYNEKHAIAKDSDTRAMLTIGSDDWPFAFPIVNKAGKWQFDAAAGKTELLHRRIGANELAAVNVLLAVVDAQREYASADRNADGVREYARAFASTPGKHDGLYWQTASNEPPSPLGPLVKSAAREGYKAGPATPYHGYYFRMLQGQGPNANGGALDYVVRGHMIGGFAAVAYPAQYANSGVMTFIVNHDGVVYQRDLGPDTAKTAGAMTRFDPGKGWTRFAD